MRIGQLLWYKLIDYEMSISDLAREVGCSQPSMRRILHEDAPYIGIDIRRGLCRALDIAPEVLDAAIYETMKAR